MNIPTHWTKETVTGTDSKGRSHSFDAWGWSMSSLEDAAAMAVQRANNILSRYLNHEPLERYFYSNLPPREEIVEELQTGDTSAAVVTRNRYGALVLNTQSCLFVDVDLPPARFAGVMDAIKQVFSSSYRLAQSEARENDVREHIASWSTSNSDYAFRLYRTCAGFRLLFTNREFDPDSDHTRRIFNELNADPLYVKLTEIQDCFRARLTPKPWRCGLPAPRYRYPLQDAGLEREKETWERRYQDAITDYSVCSQPEFFGGTDVCETVAGIVELHDRFTCGPTTLKLA